ncbi:amino acid adenylation domain-containing protein [Kitasatospora camelliae]|uniref:Amino acid adenylation domain-containing protein n=1 Tax=Kitasatospora camelliae TaxID=3156397 RepID=A0AAU8JU18_9ACTN
MLPNPSWNATSAPYPQGESIHGIVQRIAATSPEAPCLVHGDRTVDYGLLDRASDAYAAELAARGIGRGDLVPIRLPRSTELVAAVLAVLKLGAAYALIDGGWPATRVQDVLTQLDAKLLVAADPVDLPVPVPLWSPPAGGLAAVDGRAGAGFRAEAVDGGDPACVFFTSGTTGRPKGVVTPHRATVRLFRPGGFARFDSDTVMPQAAPVPWDGYSLELWSVLLNGGTSLIVDEPYLSPDLLRGAVAERGADTVWLTSSLFNMIVDEDPDALLGLRQVMIGGERVSAPHVRRFLERQPDTALINGYGPVESTVFATTHRIAPEDCDRPNGIPIGSPAPDTQIHILDGDRPCVVGEVGELCIAGDGLALRYLGRPELTAEKFTEVLVDGQPVRVYRTGDLAAWDEDGLLHYRGRADRQVKIRGHRIEPAEVERQIEDLLTPVRRCVVLAVRDGAGTCRALAAFAQPHRGGDPLDGALDTLRPHLVHYHLPEHLVPVADFPLTSNGKLDEHALLALLPDAAEPVATGPATPSGDPLTDLVAETFAAVLGLPAAPVDAAFTSLGGTSLGAGRICARLAAALERPVPVSGLVRNPTALALADWLRRTEPDGAPQAAADTPAELPLTSVQAGFLTRHLLDPEDRTGHCLAAWVVDGPLDGAALDLALADVHHRHQALDSRYLPGRGRTSSVPGGTTAPRAAHQPSTPTVQSALIAARAALSAPLDPVEGRLWHAVVAPTDAGPTVLAYAVHHIAFDGWSESVLAADLATAYTARRAGRAPTWAPVPTAAEAWSIRAAHLDAADLDAQREAAAAALRGVPDLTFPGIPDQGRPRVRRVEIDLAADQLAGLDRAADAAGLTRFAVLLTCYGRALVESTGQDDFAVGVPVAQRIDTRIEPVVGCHIGMVAVRLSGAALAEDTAVAVAESGRRIRQALSCQDVGLDEVVRAVNPPRSARAPLFQTILALQDNVPARLELGDARTGFRRLPYLGIPAELQTEIWPTPGGGLRIVVNSLSTAVPADFARGLAKTLADLVRTL